MVGSDDLKETDIIDICLGYPGGQHLEERIRVDDCLYEDGKAVITSSTFVCYHTAGPHEVTNSYRKVTDHELRF